jgi:hypothetical protein
MLRSGFDDVLGRLVPVLGTLAVAARYGQIALGCAGVSGVRKN